ncbi:MAG: hypothetical protein EBV15_02715 [Bacteroidetes bacterium]|nr:hypothetical protein [Bacteroidota bacterium]
MKVKQRFVLLFTLLLLIINVSAAQFAIKSPVINDADHPITDTIYMSASGDDNQTGSLKNPVKSFAKALSLLPFGTTGVRNGHAYGLIILLPGTYIAPVGFSQYLGDWKKGDVYKNVSVEGIGDVVIRGPADSAASNHLLYLRGDHIYVKNITLRKGKLLGLLMAGEAERHCHDIKIENVRTDSVGSFGILIKNGENIDIGNCEVMRSAQYGNEKLTSPCQWPSGLKLLGCSNFRVHHCKVGQSRGEGLNYQNSINGEAYSNSLFDNSVNYYNENSKNIIFRNNHVYNTNIGKNLYWKTCPADTGTKRTPPGILLANEGSCHNSILGGTFENCSIKCIVSGNFTEFIKTIDSIFIFNNVFQNVGAAMDLWEGSTQIIGVNCIKNVFFYNNTSIGFVGTTSSQQSVINTQFPYYNPVLNTYSSLSNIQIYNNIFCIDKQNYPNLRGYLSLFAPLHPSANVIDLKGNLWNYAFSNKVAADTVNTGLPGTINLVMNGNFNELVPGPPNMNFKLIGKPYSNTPQADYYGKARKSQTNVGAFEFDPSLEIKKSLLFARG